MRMRKSKNEKEVIEMRRPKREKRGFKNEKEGKQKERGNARELTRRTARKFSDDGNVTTQHIAGAIEPTRSVRHTERTNKECMHVGSHRTNKECMHVGSHREPTRSGRRWNHTNTDAVLSVQRAGHGCGGQGATHKRHKARRAPNAEKKDWHISDGNITSFLFLELLRDNKKVS